MSDHKREPGNGKGSHILPSFNFERASSSTDQQQQQEQSADFKFPDPDGEEQNPSDIQRPRLAKSTSSNTNLHHSSSSLLLISKLYEQQQQQGTAGSSPSTTGFQSQQHLSPSIIPSRGNVKSKPSQFDIKNKKLHKRVLSNSSPNDYFSTASKSVDNHTPSSITEEHQVPKLPSFQRVDNSTNESNPPMSPRGAIPQSNPSFGLLSSSRIFERRMAMEREGIEDINDEFLAPNHDDDDELMTENEEEDEEIEQKYKEKLNKLKQESGVDSDQGLLYATDSESESVSFHSDKIHEPHPPPADESPIKAHTGQESEKEVDHDEKEAATTDQDTSTNKQESSSSDKTTTTSPSESDDVDDYRPTHSQNRHHFHSQNTKRTSTDASSSRRSRRGSLASVPSLNSNGEPKFQGFKNAFMRFVLDEDDEDEYKIQDLDESGVNGDSGGIFSRIMGISGGGGLAPGGSTDEDRPKPFDEENQMIDADEGIQLQQMDPQIFQREAQDILQAHAGGIPRRNAAVFQGETTNGIFPAYDTADETTLKGSASSFDDSFTAPNPDLYLRDAEMELPGLDSVETTYIAPPDRVRGGVLSSLLRLYQNPMEANRSTTSLMSDLSPSVSAVTTPIDEEEEFQFDPNFKTKSSIGGRLKAFANSAANVAAKPTGKKKTVSIDDGNLQEQQDMISSHKKNLFFIDGSSHADELPNILNNQKKSKSSTNLPSFSKNRPKPKKCSGTSSRLKAKREQAAARITVHIADILQRQRFILRMCKALMLYGAPTHRLEEYLTMTARVLEIDGQFIYFPGCMIVSFGDATTRTSEVQMVRAGQGLNLYKLHRVHRIYKKVIHDLIGVEEASTQLDELLAQKPVFPPWACVLLYGFSAATVTPFAFGGGWVNLPISFGIGSCVAILQYYVAPKSNLYSNVFEVAASIVVSFLGRALGSISGANICFGAIVQGSLAMILPGYIILCGSLELQSRNIVAGAVRMFYAIIYSLFLGFGITLGAALYGWIDSNATSEAVCSTKLDAKWNILFVPFFTLGLCLINQARLFQIPIMLFISCVGYLVNYFSAKHFSDSTEFTAALGAFVIGIMGNLYSRIWKGLAVSAMLPAIFVQVPGSIASRGSLLAGLENANKLTSNSTSTSTTATDTNSLGFGVTMVQIAIGISVGLFASTIFVYPFGKKQTSVFTL